MGYTIQWVQEIKHGDSKKCLSANIFLQQSWKLDILFFFCNMICKTIRLYIVKMHLYIQCMMDCFVNYTYTSNLWWCNREEKCLLEDRFCKRHIIFTNLNIFFIIEKKSINITISHQILGKNNSIIWLK
jgi:hypothetical protein